MLESHLCAIETSAGVRIDGATVVQQSGINGLHASGDLTISNADVRLSGDGTWCYGDFTISDSAVDISGLAEYGIFCSKRLSISGRSTVSAWVTGANPDSDTSAAIGAGTIDIGKGLSITQPENGFVGEHKPRPNTAYQTVYADADSTIPAKKVTIGPTP